MSYDNKLYDPTKSADLELSPFIKERSTISGGKLNIEWNNFYSKSGYTICIIKN